jgi:hypothetical protein
MEVNEMYRMLTQVTHGLSMTRDGRLYASGQPEPEWLQQRYRTAQALRELSRSGRADRTAATSPKGVMARLRTVLRIA